MFILPDTTPPQDLDRCELCGMVIGDYKWDKRTMKVKYHYPICVHYNGHFYAVDMGCYENIQMYPRNFKFDADKDELLKYKTRPSID